MENADLKKANEELLDVGFLFFFFDDCSPMNLTCGIGSP